MENESIPQVTQQEIVKWSRRKFAGRSIILGGAALVFAAGKAENGLLNRIVAFDVENIDARKVLGLGAVVGVGIGAMRVGVAFEQVSERRLTEVGGPSVNESLVQAVYPDEV